MRKENGRGGKKENPIDRQAGGSIKRKRQKQDREKSYHAIPINKRYHVETYHFAFELN